MGGTQTSFRTLIRKIVILDLKLALSIIYWYKNTLQNGPWKTMRGKVRRNRQIWVTGFSACCYIRRYGVVRAIRHSDNRNGDLSKTAFGTYSFSTSSVRIPRESLHFRWRPGKKPICRPVAEEHNAATDLCEVTGDRGRSRSRKAQ